MGCMSAEPNVVRLLRRRVRPIDGADAFAWVSTCLNSHPHFALSPWRRPHGCRGRVLMNGRSKLFVFTIFTFAGFFFAFSVAASQIDATIDTYVVRPAPAVAAQVAAPAPATLLGVSSVGERFCNALHCVVLTGTSAHRNALEALEKQGRIAVEALPDAHRVFFQHATYDSQPGAFDRDFPGRLDVGASGSVGLFVIVFKSYPERSWLDRLEQAGLIALEPAQTMAYYFYGPRTSMATAAKRFSFVFSVVEVPTGIKRFNVDSFSDGDAPEPTVVVAVSAKQDLVLGILRSASGEDPVPVYQTGSVAAFSVPLSRVDALNVSALPEVLSVTRGGHAGPSDERTNRVVGGTFQIPGTSWPPPTPTPVLPSNTGTPRYWGNYLLQLGTVFGPLHLDLGNQTIAFLDTGVDSGLQRNGAAYCPPHLLAPDGSCRLVFTTDLTTGFGSLDTRADDPFYHGTLTTSIAGGFAGTASPGRDIDNPPSVYGGYAFTQGVAQGLRSRCANSLSIH